ncbi:MAG: hypothetical protein ACE5HX_04150 [bacterium]
MASKYGRSNPLLTNLSLARRNAREGFVADFVAPPIPTGDTSFGEYYVFNEKSFFQLPENHKASGGVSKEIFLEATVANFKCIPYGSRAGYTQKELDDFGGPELALQKAKMNMVTDADMNAHEDRVEGVVTTAGSYDSANKTTLSGTDQWDDISSDPFSQIVDAKIAIKKNAGVEPNAMVCSYSNFWTGLAKHPDILSRVQAQQKDSGFRAITPALVGSLFDVDLRVASAVKVTSNPGQSTVTKGFIWGNFALVFHRTPTPAKEIFNLAYTFTYKNFVIRTYFDEPSKKFYVDNDHDVDTKLVGADGGYLITNPTSS